MVRDFIPYALKRSGGSFKSEEIILCEYPEMSDYDKISRMQEFYRDNNADVTEGELSKLRQALVFCLNKKMIPYDDYDYIVSKAGIKYEIIRQYKNVNELVNALTNELKNMKFDEVTNKSSLADSFLRCILTFSDKYSKNRINTQELGYLLDMLESLYSKLEKINFIKKYKNFWD